MSISSSDASGDVRSMTILHSVDVTFDVDADVDPHFDTDFDAEACVDTEAVAVVVFVLTFD
jgi:hypothetical protein